MFVTMELICLEFGNQLQLCPLYLLGNVKTAVGFNRQISLQPSFVCPKMDLCVYVLSEPGIADLLISVEPISWLTTFSLSAGYHSGFPTFSATLRSFCVDHHWACMSKWHVAKNPAKQVLLQSPKHWKHFYPLAWASLLFVVRQRFHDSKEHQMRSPTICDVNLLLLS